MANTGVILLITLAIVLTIAMVILIIWGTVSYIHDLNSGGTGTVILPSCSTSVNISDLLQIPTSTPECTQNGKPTSYYYIGQIPPQTYDYVVAPFPTQPLDVCVGFCTGYTGGVCSGPSYNGKSSQDNFNQCMSQLSSTSCTPPLPIAVQGTTLYYALSPTCNLCDNCGT